MLAFSRERSSPEDLDRAIQHELRVLDTIEADHCSACRWLDEWCAPEDVKEHLACRLETRHRTEREAHVLRLAELHQTRTRLVMARIRHIERTNSAHSEQRRR